MMTRVFLAAGVAALAIAAPASAKPDRQDRQGGQAAKVERDGGGQRAQAVERRQQRAERPQRAERMAQRAERPQRIERQERMAQRAERPQRMERQERLAQRAERPQRMERQRIERAQRVERRAERIDRAQRVERRAERIERPQRLERQQRLERRAERTARPQRMERLERMQARQIDRQQARVNRVERMDDRLANRDVLRANRIERRQLRAERHALNGNQGMGFGVGGCPPGLLNKDCTPPGQTMKAERYFDADTFRASRFATLAANPRVRFVDPFVVSRYVGQPVSSLSQFASLSVLPQSVRYLYQDNDDHYYRYGGGYVYRVDRDRDLIDWILPMLAGGFLPGQYLPNSYMNSYVPNQFGLNSFYPASYGSYGSPYASFGDFGYGDDYELCNRYYGGVVYQVDCSSGYIEDVVPLYASGYGVGQMLPSSYSYYNVPSQYRSLYSNTNDYNYWYAPGAIYQYDPSNSLITSIAALLAPGFSIGQQMPQGYGMYNVPLGYRDTYYDTPNAWYRYNNGNIYQVDPTTQLVTAIVASILT